VTEIHEFHGQCAGVCRGGLNKEAPVGKKLPVVWKPPVAGPGQVCLSEVALRAKGVGLGEGRIHPGPHHPETHMITIHSNPVRCHRCERLSAAAMLQQ